MTKGALLFAHNNEKFDYFRIASLNARLIKEYLNVPVTVITDEQSVSESSSLFDEIILIDQPEEKNTRFFRDTPENQDLLPFINQTRSNAYELSPYDETLLIDADYLIQSNVLSQCWGSKYDVLISNQYTEIVANRNYVNTKVSPFGIDMYWATVVYFNKSPQSRQFFSLIEYIRENYEFYRLAYDLPDRTYRNDFSFSIAVHLMNSESPSTNFQGPIPGKCLHMAFDIDDIYAVKGKGEIVFVGNCNDNTDGILCVNQQRDIHIMNKSALLRHIDQLEDLYQ